MWGKVTVADISSNAKSEMIKESMRTRPRVYLISCFFLIEVWSGCSVFVQFVQLVHRLQKKMYNDNVHFCQGWTSFTLRQLCFLPPPFPTVTITVVLHPPFLTSILPHPLLLLPTFTLCFTLAKTTSSFRGSPPVLFHLTARFVEHYLCFLCSWREKRCLSNGHMSHPNK